jgi:hypothetical protein
MRTAILVIVAPPIRPPFGISRLQPQAGNGGPAREVLIRVQAGVDGRIYEMGRFRPPSGGRILDSEALHLAGK